MKILALSGGVLALVCGCGSSGTSGTGTGGSAGTSSGGSAGTSSGGSAGTSSGGSAGTSSGGAAGACSASTPQTKDCGADGALCASISIAGDPPATTPGDFRGYADPSLAADPSVAKRVYLGYSWTHVLPGKAPDGTSVMMAVVETHLARSDDAGASFSFVEKLWPAVPAADPEGSGENGYISSETPSLVAVAGPGGVRWYGAHLRYFLEPQTGYHPKYATSWTVRVAEASSPQALATLPGGESVLGVSTTAAVYKPEAQLDQLAGLPIQQCAILNNPTLFAQNGKLYLIVECLAFNGSKADFAHSTIQVFATTPSGAPPTWSWSYVGKLADHSLAVTLGDDTIQQPDVSLAADGTPILLVTPAHADASVAVGTVSDGCVAIELESIDPPKLRLDCNGKPKIRARLTGTDLGSCTHAAASVSGILGHSDASSPADGVSWHVHASKLAP